MPHSSYLSALFSNTLSSRRLYPPFFARISFSTYNAVAPANNTPLHTAKTRLLSHTQFQTSGLCFPPLQASPAHPLLPDTCIKFFILLKWATFYLVTLYIVLGFENSLWRISNYLLKVSNFLLVKDYQYLIFP